MVKIRVSTAYYLALLILVPAFIILAIMPLFKSIDKTRGQISELKKQTTIALLNYSGQNAGNIEEYFRSGLISRDDMVSYVVGRIHSKFKEKSVEVLNLNPVLNGSETYIDLSFKISNDSFLNFLLSLSEIGLPFFVDSANIDQQADKILVKMRVGF